MNDEASISTALLNGEITETEAAALFAALDSGDTEDRADYDAAEDGRPTRDLTAPFFTRYPRYDWGARRWLAPRELADGTIAPSGALPGYPRLVELDALPMTVDRTRKAEVL